MGGWVSVSGSGAGAVSAGDMEEAKKGIEDLISQHQVVIFSKIHCPYCVNAKKCFDKLKVKYTTIELNSHPQGSLLQDILSDMTGARTVPRVFVNGNCIGGGSETTQMFKNGDLQKMLQQHRP